MNMEDFHCDMLNMSFIFAKGDFDKPALLKAADIKDESDYKDEDGDLILSFFLSSKKDSTKQHAHLRILIKPDNSGRVSLDFHKPGVKKVKKKPPYLEDVTKWLSKVFIKKEFAATTDVAYEFDKTYQTTIPLPFPLVVDSKKLMGLKVSGLALEYPPESAIRTAIIQTPRDGPYVFLHVRTIVNLETFDLYRELRKLQDTILSLVRMRGNHEAKREKTKKARTTRPVGQA